MTSARRSIIIVGGGASGVLLAAHLLHDKAHDIRVTLIEKRRVVGQGIAYSSSQQNHVLNVPAPNMGAYADDPEHFWRWAIERKLISDKQRFVFLPRRHYGAYLADVLADASVGGQLTLIGHTAVDLKQSSAGVEVVLANGASVVGHAAVLAVGHEENPDRSKGIAVRVGSEADTPLDPDAAAMILGSGLSMVDAWLTLSQAKHRGPITIVSRHGLLPLRHKAVDKIELAAADVPFGTALQYFEHWFRETVDEVVGRDGDWRSVVDAIRPFNQRIWQSWPEASKRRFLEHVRPFWNIHRHRLPPDLHQQMVEAVESGQVTLVAGKLVDLKRGDGVVEATIRARGAGATRTLEVARVYDCGGVTVDVNRSSNPLIQALLASGQARPDPLHIGLDVTTACQVIGTDGADSDRLFAVGPLTRGTFWEIEAIPDIRVQVAAVARSLAAPVEQSSVANQAPF